MKAGTVVEIRGLTKTTGYGWFKIHQPFQGVVVADHPLLRDGVVVPAVHLIRIGDDGEMFGPQAIPARYAHEVEADAASLGLSIVRHPLSAYQSHREVKAAHGAREYRNAFVTRMQGEWILVRQPWAATA